MSCLRPRRRAFCAVDGFSVLSPRMRAFLNGVRDVATERGRNYYGKLHCNEQGIHIPSEQCIALVKGKEPLDGIYGCFARVHELRPCRCKIPF